MVQTRNKVGNNCLVGNFCWAHFTIQENMTNIIKLDLQKDRQFLGEIIADLEYHRVEYEVVFKDGDIIIEIYGVYNGL